MQAELQAGMPAQHTAAVVGRQGRERAAIGLAFALGAFLLYGVGFAQPHLLHEAAHDSRHSFAFPCH